MERFMSKGVILFKNDGVPSGGSLPEWFRDQVVRHGSVAAVDPFHENSETTIKPDLSGNLVILVPGENSDGRVREYPIEPPDALNNHLAWQRKHPGNVNR